MIYIFVHTISNDLYLSIHCRLIDFTQTTTNYNKLQQTTNMSNFSSFNAAAHNGKRNADDDQYTYVWRGDQGNQHGWSYRNQCFDALDPEENVTVVHFWLSKTAEQFLMAKYGKMFAASEDYFEVHDTNDLVCNLLTFFGQLEFECGGNDSQLANLVYGVFSKKDRKSFNRIITELESNGFYKGYRMMIATSSGFELKGGAKVMMTPEFVLG